MVRIRKAHQRSVIETTALALTRDLSIMFESVGRKLSQDVKLGEARATGFINILDAKQPLSSR